MSNLTNIQDRVLSIMSAGFTQAQTAKVTGRSWSQVAEIIERAKCRTDTTDVNALMRMSSGETGLITASHACSEFGVTMRWFTGAVNRFSMNFLTRSERGGMQFYYDKQTVKEMIRSSHPKHVEQETKSKAKGVCPKCKTITLSSGVLITLDPCPRHDKELDQKTSASLPNP